MSDGSCDRSVADLLDEVFPSAEIDSPVQEGTRTKSHKKQRTSGAEIAPLIP